MYVLLMYKTCIPTSIRILFQPFTLLNYYSYENPLIYRHRILYIITFAQKIHVCQHLKSLNLL